MENLKAYLIKAVYYWCIDNKMSPYLDIECSAQNKMPQFLFSEENIVFDISPQSVRELSFAESGVHFIAVIEEREENLFIHYDYIDKIFSSELDEGIDLAALKPTKQYPKLKLVVDNKSA